MAWTDAARAAALAARRMHAMAKAHTGGSASATAASRKDLAAEVRRARTHAASSNRLYAVMQKAAASTKTRNAQRRGAKRVLPPSAHGDAVGTIYLRKR